MTNRHAVVVVWVLVVALFPGAVHAASCASLTSLRLVNVTVTYASEAPAGSFTPPSVAGTPAAPLIVPAFCRVAGIARPTNDSVINFEVWLPPASAWNGKFLGTGNGAYLGAISYGALANALWRGYATASGDTGHVGEDMRFAEGHPEKILDWGNRSVHVVTEAATLIVRAYEGKIPLHSYFVGCSTGGHQALTEAQRYPGDFEGIVAGDPGNNRTRLNVGFLWGWLAMHHPDGSPILPAAKLEVLHKAVLDACDALDGVKDGMIGDPRRCHFDPAAIQCRGGDEGKCLTAAQVEAVRKIYAGPKNPRTGQPLFPGYSPGSEIEMHSGIASGGWRDYFIDPKEPVRTEFWKYFVFNDPNFDRNSFDFDADVAYADRKMALINAINPDLSAFKARGGKLLLFHGWADPVGPPQDTINYFEQVQAAMGGPDNTLDFVRLFMLPGMGHCRGGEGPDSFDGIRALEQWVEHGAAPDKIVASQFVSKTDAPSAGSWDMTRTKAAAIRTRPLCPYPKVARWKGTGSTDDAANFVCAVEKD